MTRLRLVVFDVDGTLVDSQGLIVSAFTAAFDAVGRPRPTRSEMLSVVGLSLPQVMARLAPDGPQKALVDSYRSAYQAIRDKAETAPFYPGARAALDRLAVDPWILLGIATGKSRRGLEVLLDAHGIADLFVTRQTADDHPSKPHPAMLTTALAETGVAAGDAVMIGDTSFDMEMAASAGIAGIGVSWGYHPVDALHRSRHVIDDFDALPGALHAIWGDA